MVFLDPLSDIAFKKLFGDQAKKSILMSFLNSILGRVEGEKIIDVTITDPYNNPDTAWLKLSIVDVRCVDQSGKHYIVEVQARAQDYYPARSQYYASLAIARQLEKGSQYREIEPVIFIGILGFSRFASPDCISHHKILNTKTHDHELKHLEFHFVELTKFTKTLEELETLVDKWLYLLAHATELQKIPTQLKNPAELEDAMDALEQGNMSPAELAAYDRFLDAQRVEFDVLETANRIAQEKGLAEGLEKGLEQGLEQGLAEGKAKAQRAMARELLHEMSIEKVAQITGLSIQDIERLKD